LDESFRNSAGRDVNCHPFSSQGCGFHRSGQFCTSAENPLRLEETGLAFFTDQAMGKGPPPFQPPDPVESSRIGVGGYWRCRSESPAAPVKSAWERKKGGHELESAAIPGHRTFPYPSELATGEIRHCMPQIYIRKSSGKQFLALFHLSKMKYLWYGSRNFTHVSFLKNHPGAGGGGLELSEDDLCGESSRRKRGDG